MKAPKNWSIRWKLTSLAMLTAALALILTIAGFAILEYFSFRRHLVDRLETLGQIIGGNVTAAIAFDRADDASTTLATLSAQPSIIAATLYKTDGTIFARYVRHGDAIPPQPLGNEGYVLSRNSMDVVMPVHMDGKTVGMLRLRSDLDELYSRIYLYGWISPLILVVAAGAGFIFASRLQQYISGPIVALAQTTQHVSENNDYSLRAVKMSNDETGVLADRFNEMLEGIRRRDDQIREHLREVQQSRDLLETRVAERTADLAKSNAELQDEMHRRHEAETKREQMQADLVEASRKAGMADVATGVLHNVGNVLNSVNVSVQILHDAVKVSRVGTLVKTTDLIKQHENNLSQFLTADERGKTIPVFLTMLANALNEEREKVLKELSGLSSSVGHIREIVSMQQSLARVAGVMTEVPLGELIEDALKINQAGLNRHQVTLIRDYDPSIVFTTDRHRVLQILINLISNAKYAVDGSSGKKEIAIRAKTIASDVQISVADTGVGIEPDNITRIFSYGFTTKKNGHGFGLHSAALAAKELGGSIEVHSEGKGKGATFTLTLPIRKEALSHAG